ncbi:MAG: acyl-CoA thioesterase [Desulfarculaceae bacterium]
MQGKRVADSMVTLAMQMQPHDANHFGNVHGGVVMKQIDNTAGVVAIRHSGQNAVTASIDRLDFHHPVYIGDVLILHARLNHVGRSSMEVEVNVEAETPRTGERRQTATAFLTFVALDSEGQPAQAPPLILETPEEINRSRLAKERRKQRLAEKTQERQSQS